MGQGFFLGSHLLVSEDIRLLHGSNAEPSFTALMRAAMAPQRHGESVPDPHGTPSSDISHVSTVLHFEGRQRERDP